MMKVKIIIFTAFFLAAASLGLALPSAKAPASPKLAKPSGSVQISQVLQKEGVPDDLIGDLKSLTPQCQTAILSIIVSPEFLKCIPIPAFIPLVPILSDPTTIPKVIADPKNNFKLVEGPFLQFSKGFCPAPKCSDDGVSKAIKTLQDECKTDLADGKNQLIQLLFSLFVLYSPLHDTICFKNADKFCWDETMTTFISFPKSPFKIVDGGFMDSIAVADPPKVCTKCNKNIVNTFLNFLKDNNQLALQVLTKLGITDKILEGLKVGVAVKCGISFEDGKIVP